MSSKSLHTSKNGHITLFEDSFACGREGQVFFIEGDSSECVKIFNKDKISNALHQKIITMINNPPKYQENGVPFFAWPTSILYNDSDKTQFVGYSMPLVNLKEYQESHRYFDADDRNHPERGLGGEFTWEYLLTSAKNIALITGFLHQKGFRIGDFRDKNIFIAPDCSVIFIDCDSFQIKDPKSGRIFYCQVFDEQYTPPYISENFQRIDDIKTEDLVSVRISYPPGFSGAPISSEDTTFSLGFNEIDRYSSDLFALGVIVFQFLMEGAHPYNGFGALVDDAPSIADKIKVGCFAYNKDNGGGIKPPDASPSYDILPPTIQSLFYRCFVEGHKIPDALPKASEWQEVLQQMRSHLKKCDVNPNHVFSDHLSDCPWCTLKKKTGEDHFPCKIESPPVIQTKKNKQSDEIKPRIIEPRTTPTKSYSFLTKLHSYLYKQNIVVKFLFIIIVFIINLILQMWMNQGFTLFGIELPVYPIGSVDRFVLFIGQVFGYVLFGLLCLFMFTGWVTIRK